MSVAASGSRFLHRKHGARSLRLQRGEEKRSEEVRQVRDGDGDERGSMNQTTECKTENRGSGGEGREWAREGGVGAVWDGDGGERGQRPGANPIGQKGKERNRMNGKV